MAIPSRFAALSLVAPVKFNAAVKSANPDGEYSAESSSRERIEDCRRTQQMLLGTGLK